MERKLAELLAVGKDARWLETRQHGKETRKITASVLYDFANYARSQGDIREVGHIIAEFTIPCNLAVGLPKRDGRDSANVQQLNCLDLIEGNVKKIIVEGMSVGLHYTQIKAQVQVWIDRFLEVVFGGNALLR